MLKKIRSIEFEALWQKISDAYSPQDLGIPDGFDTPMGWFMSSSKGPNEEQLELLLSACAECGIEVNYEKPKSKSVMVTLGPLFQFMRTQGLSQAQFARTLGKQPGNMSVLTKASTVNRKWLEEEVFTTARMLTRSKNVKSLESAIRDCYDQVEVDLPRGAIPESTNLPFDELVALLRKAGKSRADLAIEMKISTTRIGQYLRSKRITPAMFDRALHAAHKLLAKKPMSRRELRKMEERL